MADLPLCHAVYGSFSAKLEDISKLMRPLNSYDGEIAGRNGKAPWSYEGIIREALVIQPGPFCKTYETVMKLNVVAINAELELFLSELLVSSYREARSKNVDVLRQVNIIKAAFSANNAGQFALRLVEDPKAAVDEVFARHEIEWLNSGMNPTFDRVMGSFSELFCNPKAGDILNDAVGAVYGSCRLDIPQPQPGNPSYHIKVRYARIEALKKVSVCYYFLRNFIAHGNPRQSLSRLDANFAFEPRDFLGADVAQVTAAANYFNRFVAMFRSHLNGNGHDLEFTYVDYIGYLRFSKDYSLVLYNALTRVLIPPEIDDPFVGDPLAALFDN